MVLPIGSVDRTLQSQPSGVLTLSLFVIALACAIGSMLMIVPNTPIWHVIGWALGTAGSTCAAFGWRAANVQRAYSGIMEPALIRRFGTLAMVASLAAALAHSVFLGVEFAT